MLVTFVMEQLTRERNLRVRTNFMPATKTMRGESHVGGRISIHSAFLRFCESALFGYID